MKYKVFQMLMVENELLWKNKAPIFIYPLKTFVSKN